MSLTLQARNTTLPTLLSGTVYVALHTADPGDDASANECTDGSYTRQSTTFTLNSGIGQSANDLALSFNFANATTITHMSVWSAQTGGTPAVKQALAAPVAASGSPLIIAVAAGDITIGGPS